MRTELFKLAVGLLKVKLVLELQRVRLVAAALLRRSVDGLVLVVLDRSTLVVVMLTIVLEEASLRIMF